MNDNGIPNKPNNALLVNFRKNASPRQKQAIGRMSGFGTETKTLVLIAQTFPKLPGASIAIQALRKQMITKGAVINDTFFPPDCFCREFTADGEAILSSIVDKKYKDGITLGQLAKALGFFGDLVPETKKEARAAKVKLEMADTPAKPEVDKYGEEFHQHLTVRRVRLV